MNTLESLITRIQGLSAGGSDLAALHGHLKQAEETLNAESANLLPFLDHLNPSIHTLGYLYFLDACSSGPITKEHAQLMVSVVSNFISLCSAEQIHLAPEKFVSVCKTYKDQVMILEAPMRGVAPFLKAVKKLQPSSEHLTPLHPEFLQLCLLSKCYKLGFSVLEDDIFEVDQPRDLFLYCYYGGMICVGLKKFTKALELFHLVVTAPMTVISAIAVEAYKKYILVSLIHNGQFSSNLPKYSSSSAQRNLKNLCQPYVELANSYSTGRMSEVEALILTNHEKFDGDKNLGLVKQVASSLSKRNIQRLTQTYLTLSLQDIASSVELKVAKDAEMHVLQMIEDRQIYATINQKDGMVRFLEDPEQYKTCEMIERIDGSIRRMISLSKKLKGVDETMSCDPSYLGKVGRDKQRYELDDFETLPRYNI